MSDSLSSVWGHLVHFAKFPLLRVSKGYYSHSFHPISTKENIHIIAGNTGYFAVWRSAKKKNCWRFEILVNTGKYGVVNFTTLLLLQFSSNPSQTSGGQWLPWRNIGYYFVGNRQSFKNSVVY